MSFHSGEIAVQNQAGVQEEARRLLSGINSVIQPKAEEFLGTQQFAAASTVDANGKVWASLLLGEAGFIKVLNQQSVQINPISTAKDILYSNLKSNSHIGILAIDLTNRRRLRLNGKAEIQKQEISEKIIKLEIKEVFFNCPKYIQTRHLEISEAESPSQSQIFNRKALSNSNKNWISQSDTFFIASFNPEIGADASHRGGNPGFVRVVNDNKLVFPDYAGNNMFQTFGNFAINPNAGIIFVDFENGHTLQLTGKAKIVWDAEKITEFAGAKRLVEFDIEEVLETQNATNWSWKFGKYSPANP
ncbi:pyridoxamine 5'-phosphate oxidase-related, FMN binding protein [Rivularia sp. PCC 7116]|uniref:pyridoxamine 5'-phosphate oxidase family protein n=1 Tax=Rivularia sp. PCC 7116 TaxID=373994 RepID=UPI00029F2CDA|nr:pyridoxamine 5'-phosphate oxidase family protein [Rivularia sp. PCC 7116]AFY57147.1 pyridoxamine 5'-phosphate oxidase-related, FMN binding protein [Rivularia sp. PCC 7116]